MLKAGQFWTLIVVTLIAAALAGTSAVLYVENQRAQAEVAQRAQYIQQSMQLEVLFREIVKALADLSIRNNDGELRSLLSANGITVGPAPAPAAAPASVEPKKGSR